MVEIISTTFSARFLKISYVFANSRRNCGATKIRTSSLCKQLKSTFHALKTQKTARKSVHKWHRHAYMKNRTSSPTVKVPLTARAWQKITKKLLFFSFSCRRMFINLHQTLHADRGRQYKFFSQAIIIEIRSLVFALWTKTLLGF